MQDKAEFEAYFRQDYSLLIRFVMNLGAQRCTAEDVVMNTLLEALQNWDVIEHPRAWVRKVATRKYLKAIDHDIHRFDTLEDAPLVLATLDVAEHFAQRDLVQAALQRLPDKQRIVMAWTIDGYPPKCIAEELEFSADSVRKILQRARENLKSFLGRDDDWEA
ncbi:sigma-70 family RNA polymerase sigma factor [Actinomadura sp. NPDC048021]|uniref:RNA polymerase sigma factor n=1 Tax=Actinomadura sp. NPDC048021 TaxID=3155385 RepID=UPI0033E450D3